MDLSPIEWMGLKACAKLAEPYREKVEAGKGQEFDFTVRVRGMLDVGEDTETTRSKAPKPAELVAAILESLSEDQRKLVVESVRENWSKGEERAGLDATVRAGELIASLTTQETSPQKGSVRGTPLVEVVRAHEGAMEWMAASVGRIITDADYATVVGYGEAALADLEKALT